MIRVLLNLVRDYQQKNSLVMPTEWIETFSFLLENRSEDKFLLAEMLSLPSEKYVGEQMDVIDVVAIHAAREFAITEIAKHLEKLF